jgi:hypothetical protein
MNPDDFLPPPPLAPPAPAPFLFDEASIFNATGAACPPHLFRVVTRMGGGEFRSWWSIAEFGRN